MARLRGDQITQALGKSLKPIYTVSGDEPLLVQEACDSLRKLAKKRGFSEREVHHADGNFQWLDLLNSANSLSLFSDKKIIEIRVPNGKPGEQGSKILNEYLEKPNPDSLLLLILPKLDKRTQNTKWFKTLENKGDVVIIWPINRPQLPRWLAGRLNKAGLNATDDALDILCAKVEGNLLAAVQEIEKLKLLAPESGEIDTALMASVVMDSARYDVFSLVDKALHGDCRGAADNLKGLQGEGSEPPIILWALARDIRLLCTLQEGVKRGEKFDVMCKKNGVWDTRKALIKSALRRVNHQQLQHMLKKCSLADHMIKGLHTGNVWSLLLDITLNLSGIQSLNDGSEMLLLNE